MPRGRAGCDFRDCDAPATVKLRFGDGTWSLCGTVRRQTFAHYCDRHGAIVQRWFVTRDLRAVSKPKHTAAPKVREPRLVSTT